MSKSFPEWWKHGQKVRTVSDGILTLNIAEDAEYWLTNDAGKEVSVFSADILGPASTPEACRMTTDITELAQREKFEAWAEEVGAQPWGYLKKQRNPSGGYSVQIYTYMWTAWKAAGAELVEALEKAQTENTAGVAGMAESYETTISMLKSRIAELEESNVQVIQSRDHYKRMTEEGLKRLAESRTVKLPEGDERDDLIISITEEIAHLKRCVERYIKEGMASTTQEMEQRLLVQKIALSVLNSAAGIKWEGE